MYIAMYFMKMARKYSFWDKVEGKHLSKRERGKLRLYFIAIILLLPVMFVIYSPDSNRAAGIVLAIFFLMNVFEHKDFNWKTQLYLSVIVCIGLYMIIG